MTFKLNLINFMMSYFGLRIQSGDSQALNLSALPVALKLWQRLSQPIPEVKSRVIFNWKFIYFISFFICNVESERHMALKHLLGWWIESGGAIAVCAGFRLNNSWANGTVLKPFLNQKAPFPQHSLVSSFKPRISNSWPSCGESNALAPKIYTT